MSSKRKFLFISIDGMTDQLGQSQVTPYLLELAKTGINIEIVSCEKKENFVKNNSVISELLKHNQIVWNYCFYKTWKFIFSQYFNYRSLKKLTLKRILQNNKAVTLHCRSYLPGLIGLEMKKRFGAGFIFDMRGFWADERIDGDIWKLNNPIHLLLYKYFKRKEKLMIGNSNRIITLTEAAKKEILSWNLPVVPEIEIIPCCADLNHFKPVDDKAKNEIKSMLQIPVSTFVLGYLGSIGSWYLLSEMLDFYKRLLKQKQDSIFLFVTNDDEKQISEYASLKKIPKENIKIISATRNEVPGYIACFDLGIFFIKPTYSKKASSPTKLAEILACGKPVITNCSVGDVDQFISETKSGIIVPSFDTETYDQTLKELEKLLALNNEHFRSSSEKHFSLQQGVLKYHKIYSEFGS